MARSQVGQIMKFTANQMHVQDARSSIFRWTQIAEHFHPDVLGQIDPLLWSLMKLLEWAEIKNRSLKFCEILLEIHAFLEISKIRGYSYWLALFQFKFLGFCFAAHSDDDFSLIHFEYDQIFHFGGRWWDEKKQWLMLDSDGNASQKIWC